MEATGVPKGAYPFTEFSFKRRHRPRQRTSCVPTRRRLARHPVRSRFVIAATAVRNQHGGACWIELPHSLRSVTQGTIQTSGVYRDSRSSIRTDRAHKPARHLRPVLAVL